ncbi:PNGase F N-terminal domain-containing protein [uncultured Lacinutrix sp.]|uniref:PNGase F N-terminal domain-containing protein n=1 Tax=uncultured Lacinutrix sp. TaxID=574032 RepID=UPI0026210F6C|nr:PNGase F N-terminal domain-containing protein [uncultured Lacinutrix sp.]
MKFKLGLLSLFILTACKKEVKPIGDHYISIFDNTNLYFDMGFKDGSKKLNDSILRLDAGRVLVKKIKLPNYKLQPKVTVNVTLTSNGDPWDKAGSLFVIPKNSNLNLVDFETGKFDLKTLKQEYPVITLLEKDSLNYKPNIELIRFMTPFGVGHFTNDERVKDRKPPYIPHWEENVKWSQEITHLLPLLENEVYIGVYVDTWTKEGYNISVNLDFKESEIPNHIKNKQTVIPLVNTSKYAAEQKLYDDFSKQPLSITFTAKEQYKNAKLYFITTGHGGHSGGDEFVKKEHQIDFDGKNIKTWIPWRDDCASFRRFNPTSGTWSAKEFMPDEKSDDKIASSDLSRSNWCPGSQVLPEIIDLGDVAIGDHTLKIQIPEAQVATETENNYWMISAYILYDNE